MIEKGRIAAGLAAAADFYRPLPVFTEDTHGGQEEIIRAILEASDAYELSQRTRIACTRTGDHLGHSITAMIHCGGVGEQVCRPDPQGEHVGPWVTVPFTSPRQIQCNACMSRRTVG